MIPTGPFHPAVRARSAIAAWRSTAGVYRDPEQLEALLSADEDDIAELFPPAEMTTEVGAESV
jgi:hypothetical protein